MRKIMKKRTKELKSQIGVYSRYKHRMQVLQDSFKGQTCYILSCGPSIAEINNDEVKSILKDELVFTVKQAYFLFKGIVDFHFFNCNNFTPYTYTNNTIYCSQADALSEELAQRFVWGNQRYDLNFILRDNKIHENKLCNTKNYDYWMFKNRLNRPWGPSIMHETILYMAVHLGVNKIRTIGWDHINPNGTEYKIKHFYDKGDYNYKIFSKANPLDVGEIESKIQMSKEKSEWLSSKGIELEVYDSDKCHIHPSVKRFKFLGEH